MDTAGPESVWPQASSTPPWDHVLFAPPAEFVVRPEFSREIPAKEGWHLTQLCWERQVDVEAETSFHCSVIRLETPLAVQHQSQWRVNLDPRYHHLVLHWLRVVRDGQQIDQLQRDRLRLMQRETQLEHLVIDGQWTLLRVLDDVRVGDTIEYAYSFVGPNPVRPQGCDIFFFVPPGTVVGNFGLRVTFAPGRPAFGRLTAEDAPAVTETKLSDGRICWSWTGSQLEPRRPEPNQPSTFLDYLWIQVSDLAEWSPLCARLAETWGKTIGDTAVPGLPAFARPVEVNESRILALVQYLQDEFRYLSVDLEIGGWIPQRPDIVAARRYGDCKDLVWLATQVLREWGVAARPILVGTGFRDRVKTLRPMALLFNHAVLEVEIAGTRRWFDLTIRSQGGDFHHRWIGEFGVGLPVEANAQALVEQPNRPDQNVFAVRETILLDTRRGEPSALELRVWTEGPYAENLRRKQLSEGLDEFARGRLRFLQGRYPKAIRLGALHCRDNRDRNTFEIAEAFQFKDVVYTDETGKRALFDVPGNLIIQTLHVPEDRPRRAPWGLPFPIELRHQFVILAGGMGFGKRRSRRWVSPEFVGTIDEPRHVGEWTKTIRVAVKATEVPAARVNAYRQELDRFLRSSTWRLFLPLGRKSAGTPEHFGELPPTEEGVSAYVPPADPSTFKDASPDSASEDGKIIRHGTFLSRLPGSGGVNWRFTLPVMFLAMMLLSRTCSDLPVETSGNFENFTPKRTQKFSTTSLPTFANSATADEVLPPGPEIHGDIYRHANEVDQVPVPLSRPTLTYPPGLQAIGVEGEALVDFVVTDQGIPTRITVVKQSLPDFGQAASVGISKWRFRPAMKGGHPVNMELQIPIAFKLGANPPLKAPFDSNHRENLDNPLPLSPVQPVDSK